MSELSTQHGLYANGLEDRLYAKRVTRQNYVASSDLEMSGVIRDIFANSYCLLAGNAHGPT